MEGVREKTLFVKWALLNAVFIAGLIGLAASFGGRVHGVVLAVIPIILLLGAYGSAYGGRLCWEADSARYDWKRTRLVHRAKYLDHWAWMCAMFGILSSIAGMSILLSSNDATTLGDRVTSGGGGIFYGTFIGVLTMLLLKHEQRMIEHDLDIDG